MTQTLKHTWPTKWLEIAYEHNLVSKCGDGYCFRTDKERETMGEFARQIAENAVEEYKATEQEYVAEDSRLESYSIIDRYLRNNLDDSSYSDYSACLDDVYHVPQLSDETVKDAARWRAIIKSGAYSPSDFGNPIGFAGRLGQYSSNDINKSVDRWIDEAMKAEREGKS